jgi:hypothetical protein
LIAAWQDEQNVGLAKNRMARSCEELAPRRCRRGIKAGTLAVMRGRRRQRNPRQFVFFVVTNGNQVVEAIRVDGRAGDSQCQSRRSPSRAAKGSREFVA